MCFCNHWDPRTVCDQPGCKLLALNFGRVAPIQGGTKITAESVDTIIEKLDELADIAEIWKRNRDKGRKPSSIRAALVMLSCEISALALKDSPSKPSTAEKAKETK